MNWLKSKMEPELSKIVVSPELEQRTFARIAESAQREARGHIRRSSAVLIAAAMVVVLASAAFAANRMGLLNRLFGGNAPSEEAQQLLVEPNTVIERNGTRLTINEYVQDGNTLSITWTVESTLNEPVFYGIDEVRLAPAGIAPQAGNYIEELVMLGGTLDGEEQPKSHEQFVRCEIPAELRDKRIDVAIQAKLYTTDREIVVSDADEFEASQDKLFVSPGGRVRPIAYADVLSTLLTRKGTDVGVFEELGYVKPLANLSAGLTLDLMEPVGTHTTVDGANSFEFPDYTLVVDKLDFSAASVILEFSVYPVKPVPYDQDGLESMTHMSHTLLDAQGWEFLVGSGGVSSAKEDNDGNIWRVEYTYEWLPAAQTPQQVVLMPVGSFESDAEPGTPSYERVRREHFRRDEAVTLHIKPQ